MKKVKIPFSLSEYKKGGYKVESRDGRSVRIICTDVKEYRYPILGLLTSYDGFEFSIHCNENGKSNEPSFDLFLVKEEFEDGDIVYTNDGESEIISILRTFGDDEKGYYCSIMNACKQQYNFKQNDLLDRQIIRLATEQEKQKLFNILKKENMIWNEETKKTEDIAEGKSVSSNTPKFKKGDILSNKYYIFMFNGYTDDIEFKIGMTAIFNKCGGFLYSHIYDGDSVTISSVHYATEKEKETYRNALKGHGYYIDVYGNLKQIEKKFAVSDLKPFDKVLVRDYDTDDWDIDFFSRNITDGDNFPFLGINNTYGQCIPYNEETKDLLGTDKECPKKYINW